jgi:glutamate-ammonia-ligase adenylyltransferase
VIALGKHGSQELNYSSDIDPILLYDPADDCPRRARARSRTRRRCGSAKPRSVQLSVRTRTADGYVFRVDLRLRPSPEATPIMRCRSTRRSATMRATAVGWEQAAFIRARACARATWRWGEYFLQAIRPFIWRRSRSISVRSDAISDVSRRIRAHYAGRASASGRDTISNAGAAASARSNSIAQVAPADSRRPRSGAARAGRRATALARRWRKAGIITAGRERRGIWIEAYVMLRTIEHRLQMVDDRQTHELPPNPQAMDNVAQLHGLADGSALLGALAPHVEAVGLRFDELVGDDEGEAERVPDSGDALADWLEAQGVAEIEPFLARLSRWRDGSLRALKSAPAREALEELLPGLLRQIAKAPAPVMALNRLDDVIAGLPSAVNLLRLLVARPALAQTLVLILAYAPTLAAALARHPALFEGLIDQSALDLPASVPDLVADMRRRDTSRDFQEQLDHVRRAVGERRFGLGVQLIQAESDPIEVGKGYARVAEAAVDVLAQAAIAEFEAAHGKVPGGDLVILALGRFGGGLLTHASDLDLIFLFTGDFHAESDGPRPLGATLYFNRLTTRVINALSVQTAAGALYEVDTRLRPSGTQGPLAVSFESFARYQAEAAWTWEHLALNRARVVFGPEAARTELEDIIARTLRTPRDTAALLRSAVKMRGDIATHKPPAGPLDVKLVPGGLVDLEFLIHVTQLSRHTGFAPALATALDLLIGQGLLDPALRPAADLLTRYLVVSRLVTPGSTEPPEESRWLVAKSCGAADWNALLARIEAARQSVSTGWNALVKQAEG